MKEQTTLSLTQEQWLHFKSKYNQAVEDDKKSFMFMDYEVLVSYAKYLLEWQEGKNES